MGMECSAKNTCLRYTDGIKNANANDNYMRKCSNQKKFLQDDTKVVKGR